MYEVFMKYADLNAFDLIAGVFYSRILSLNIAFYARLSIAACSAVYIYKL